VFEQLTLGDHIEIVQNAWRVNPAAKAADMAEMLGNRVLLGLPGIYQTKWKSEILADRRALHLQKNKPRVRVEKVHLDAPAWMPINTATVQQFAEDDYVRNRRGETLYNPKYVPPWQPDARPDGAKTVELKIPEHDILWTIRMLVFGFPQKALHTTRWPHDSSVPEKSTKRGKPSLQVGEDRFDVHIAYAAPKADDLRREAYRQVLVYQKPAKEVAEVFKIPYETLKRQLTRVSTRLLTKVNEPKA
jgi:hypothetical protein